MNLNYLVGRYRLAFIILLLVFAFYSFTLQPSLSWGDGTRLQREAITGESFILAEMVNVEFAPDPLPLAKVGVAAWDHPLYIALGHALVQLFPSIDSLWLVNIISALFGAASIALLYLLCYSNTRSMVAALIGAFSLAVSHTFWWHSVTPEVYTLFSFLLLLSLFFFDKYQRGHLLNNLLIGSFILGLAVSDHLLALLALPSILLYYLFSMKTRQHYVIRYKPFLMAGLAFLAGFSFYAIQFIRMLRTFPLSEIMGPVVGTPFLNSLIATTPQQILESLRTYLFFLLLQFNPLSLILAICGLWVGRKAYPLFWKKIIAFYVVYTLFGIFYRVSDQFAFFLSSYIFLAGVISIGAAWSLSKISQRKSKMVLVGGLVILIVVTPVFYQALPGIAHQVGFTDQSFNIPQIGIGLRDGLNYYVNPNKRGDYTAYQFGYDTLINLPKEAVVVAHWYPDTDEYFILRYFQTVEHMRSDVEVIGWPKEDILNFDARTAVARINSEIQKHPLFLASLNERYYAASELMKTYCIIPENNLYRLYKRDQITSINEEKSCIVNSKVEVLP
jgi:hypothetical protein